MELNYFVRELKINRKVTDHNFYRLNYCLAKKYWNLFKNYPSVEQQIEHFIYCFLFHLEILYLVEAMKNNTAIYYESSPNSELSP